jgi:hypothetical protein
MAGASHQKWLWRVFSKFFISNAVDGTDNHVLWNDSEEGEDVRSECEEEGTDCGVGNNDTDW